MTIQPESERPESEVESSPTLERSTRLRIGRAIATVVVGALAGHGCVELTDTMWAAPAHAAHAAQRAASTDSPAARYASKTISEINEQRAKHGLVGLDKNKCLTRFAVKQAARMAEQRRLFHQDLAPILEECNVGRVGENVAYGYPSGRAVVKAWMKSPPHRANILNGKFRRIGVGARRGGGHWWVAGVFSSK